MDITLTKDTEKLLCEVYKQYLERRKSGMAKRSARDFGNPEKWPEDLFSSYSKSDILDALRELKNVGMVRTYLNCGFVLLDPAIIYMENRFPDGVSQVLEWLAKIKNAIPFA